jgi:hypothetical protein
LDSESFVTEARDLLHERSRSYLLEMRHAVEVPFREGSTSTAQERDGAVTLGRSLFVQLSRVLKLALDARDVEGFIETERSWAAMFADAWVPDEPQFQTPEQRDLLPLLRSRDVLRLGLAMWAGHLLAGPRAPEGQEVWRTALQVLGGRFTDLEQLLDVYDQAREREQSDGSDWTGWFLSELPEGEAHFIPTSSELLFVTLLLAARLAGTGERAPLRPRDWMLHGQEIDTALERLEQDSERWSWLLNGGSAEPTTAWHESVIALRRLVTEAQIEARARDEAELRQAPVDPDKVLSFRTLVVTTVAGERVMRDTFARQDAWERAAAAPRDHEPRSLTWWVPKASFVPESRVVGIEFMARDIAREANAEIPLFAEYLAQLDPPAATPDASALADDVSAAIAEMRGAGLRPSLLLLPLAWRLKERLGLPVGRGAAPADPLIPLAHQRRFAGVVDAVPAIDVPRLPDDRFFLVDLRAAATFVEWPSEHDAGIDIEVQAFDARSANDLIRQGRVGVGTGQTVDQVALLLQQQLRVSVTLTWMLLPGNPDAVRAFAVPVELQRSSQ